MSRTCVWMGIAAIVSLFAALSVMFLIADTPQIDRWFLLSSAVAGISFLGAIAVSLAETHVSPPREP